MSQPNPQQGQPRPQATATPHTRDTFVLVPDEPTEQSICRDYWADKNPGSLARVVSELKMARLNDASTVIALYRKPPARPTFNRLDGGLREAVPSAMPVLEAKPVKINGYWTEDGEDGRLDQAAVVRAIATQCLPLRAHYDGQTMRLLLT